MLEFLKLQYAMGKITYEQLHQLVVNGKISEEELSYIVDSKHIK
jgi:hypothetical protein